jgi:hypothetical protein
MGSTRPHRDRAYRVIHIIVALLSLLVPGPAAWAQESGRPAEATRERRATPGLDVRVHDGRLSVNVQAADLGEVLKQIGRQASIKISAGPSAGKRVSARFAGVALEEGIRRLLRQVSLSHLFLYAPGPGGSVVLAEVRVSGEGKDTPPPQATITEPGVQEQEQPSSPPGRKSRQPAPGIVEPVQKSTSEPELGEPSEATRRVLDVFKQSKAMGRKPPDGQATSPTELTPPSQEPGSSEGGTR